MMQLSQLYGHSLRKMMTTLTRLGAVERELDGFNWCYRYGINKIWWFISCKFQWNMNKICFCLGVMVDGGTFSFKKTLNCWTYWTFTWRRSSRAGSKSGYSAVVMARGYRLGVIRIYKVTEDLTVEEVAVEGA